MQIKHGALSADGYRLALLKTTETENQLQVFALNAFEEGALAVVEVQKGLDEICWSPCGCYIAGKCDPDGQEKYGLFVHSLYVERATVFFSEPDISVQSFHFSQTNPDVLLVTLFSGQPNKIVCREIDLANLALHPGERELPFEEVWFDNDFQPLVTKFIREDGSHHLDSPVYSEFSISVPLKHNLHTRVLGINRAENIVYLSSSLDRGNAALVSHSLTSQQQEILAADEHFDLLYPLFDATGNHIVAASFYGRKINWQALTTKLAEFLQVLEKFNQVRLVDYCAQSQILLFCSDPNSPACQWWLFSIAKGLIALNKPKTEHNPNIQQHSFSITTSDGLDVMGFLSTPAEVDTNTPLIVNLHGGPWIADPGFDNPVNNWFAERGYAVLGINFRGSYGEGEKFLNKGNQQWALRIIDDIEECLAHTLKHFSLNNAKVFLMGRSFGGYAALQTAIRLKEKVAGVISIYGPANISELLASMPTEWSGTAESIAQRVGDWRTATGRDFLLSSSPCSYVEHIDCPVLLIHGEQDRRVPLSQSRDLAQQLLELKKHVACIEVAEMGHGLNDFWSWEGTYQAVTGFLAMQISGKKMGEEFLPKDNRFRFGAISVPPS